MPNFMPLYSMWKPATISDSASSRSNGVRPVSASEEMKKMSAETGAKRMNGNVCAAMMPSVDMVLARMMGTSRARIIGTS